MNSLTCFRLCVSEARLFSPCCKSLSRATLLSKPKFRLKQATRSIQSHFLPSTSYTSLKCYSTLPKVEDKVQRTSNTKDEKETQKVVPNEPQVKLSLFKRFKIMYRDYWYVLVPVHLVTSTFWFGGFYYLAKSGVDIVSILESWNVSDRIVNPLKDSSMGYLAISYACYKLATPLRYTVTLGGTTISINYLKRWGYIKPVPSTTQLKEIYMDKKENIMETVRETKEIYKEKKDNIIETVRGTKELYKEKKDNIIDTVRDTTKELRLQRQQSKVDTDSDKSILSTLDEKVQAVKERLVDDKKDVSNLHNITKKK